MVAGAQLVPDGARTQRDHEASRRLAIAKEREAPGLLLNDDAVDERQRRCRYRHDKGLNVRGRRSGRDHVGGEDTDEKGVQHEAGSTVESAIYARVRFTCQGRAHILSSLKTTKSAKCCMHVS